VQGAKGNESRCEQYLSFLLVKIWPFIVCRYKTVWRFVRTLGHRVQLKCSHVMDKEDLDDMEKEMQCLVSEVEEDGDEDLEDIDDEGLEHLQNSDYSTRVMEIARPRGEQAPSQVDR